MISTNKLKFVSNRLFITSRLFLFLGFYRLSIKLMEVSAELSYMYNWKYLDQGLEDLIHKISRKYFIKTNIEIVSDFRVVIYDVFALTNRGLSFQYFKALNDFGYEVLFIIDKQSISASKNFIEILNNSSNTKVKIVDLKRSSLREIHSLQETIVNFGPKSLFLHLHPSSVLPLAFVNSLTGIKIYNINLTDHAFWLGISCIDYNIEFRDYGFNVSSQHRHFSTNKCLKLPFYPNNCSEFFKGLPTSNLVNPIKVFTGGSFYKFYGLDGLFFDIIENLLNLNPNILFYIAGSGNTEGFESLINNPALQNRIFLLGDRDDISEIFRNIDIYLCSLPITGGLMAQLSAVNSKPILSYTPAEYYNMNNLSEFLSNAEDIHFTFTDISDFYNYASKLFSNKDFRIQEGIKASKGVISSKDFSIKLVDIISKPTYNSKFSSYKIDVKSFHNLYLDSENRFNPQFLEFLLRKMKLFIFIIFPFTSMYIIFKKPRFSFNIFRQYVKF